MTSRMILLTCPRCHKADDDCQCWPLANIRQQMNVHRHAS